MRISTSFLSISSSVVRDRLQNTPDSAIPLAVNIITSSLLLITPFKNCNLYHLGKGTDMDYLIWINLETIPDDDQVTFNGVRSEVSPRNQANEVSILFNYTIFKIENRNENS